MQIMGMCDSLTFALGLAGCAALHPANSGTKEMARRWIIDRLDHPEMA